jgi:Zn-dependent peptidase ImmA (M78 family)/transcriptional regulator with XRE-family HTH domain
VLNVVQQTTQYMGTVMLGDTTFGVVAKKARLKAGFSLRQAARQLEISPSYLSKIELDKCDPPSAELIEEMADLYSITWEALAKYAKERSDELIGSETQAKKHLLQLFRVARGLPEQDVKQLLERFLNELDPEKRDEIKALLKNTEFPRTNNQKPQQVEPRLLSGINLRNYAERILAQFGLNRATYKPPTPIEKIIEHTENVFLSVKDDFQRRSDGSPFVLGVTKWDLTSPNKKLIEIDESLYDSDDQVDQCRLRFTLGHEYFHAIEHLDLAKKQFKNQVQLNRTVFTECQDHPGKKQFKTNEDWQEWQANRFAAEILMPDWSVKKIVSKTLGGCEFRAAESSATKEQLARKIGNLQTDTRKTICEVFEVSNQAMAYRLMHLGIVI